jgi:hypothetical protein
VNDDYARFVNALIVPLARADVATWILDNTGHDDAGRPRGASAKSDLNEVVFSLVAVESFDRKTRGKVVWRRKRQRFSGIPVVMEQELGGGTYLPPVALEQDRKGGEGPLPSHLPDGAGLPARGGHAWQEHELHRRPR